MKISGHIIVDGREVAETATCAHCQYTWEIVRGSGIERGFCINCMKPTCGKPQCHPCIPFLKKLDLMEKYGR